MYSEPWGIERVDPTGGVGPLWDVRLLGDACTSVLGGGKNSGLSITMTLYILQAARCLCQRVMDSLIPGMGGQLIISMYANGGGM